MPARSPPRGQGCQRPLWARRAPSWWTAAKLVGGWIGLGRGCGGWEVILGDRMSCMSFALPALAGNPAICNDPPALQTLHLFSLFWPLDSFSDLQVVRKGVTISIRLFPSSLASFLASLPKHNKSLDLRKVNKALSKSSPPLFQRGHDHSTIP